MAREPAGRDLRVLSDLWFPLFDELADPSAIVLLSAEAEEAGWHGVFVGSPALARPCPAGG